MNPLHQPPPPKLLLFVSKTHWPVPESLLTYCNHQYFSDISLLVANTQDAATEKHVPVITRKDGKVIVKVGSASHPMTDAHFIQFIALVSEKGVQRVDLTPADEPKAEFVDPEGPVAAYEFCNLHGLWKAEA